VHHSASTAAATAPPFTLSPLNEFDEEFNNPLNNAMIIESTATGFLWSKTRGGGESRAEPPTAVADSRMQNEEVNYRLREHLDALNHSF
jgi:hypothetical protein